jgi:hypothetical protein
MKYGVSLLYASAALVSGGWELYLMMRPLIGGPQSWWYPVMFGASILLLVGVIYTLFPRLKKPWLIVLVSAVPLLLCGILGSLEWRCWVYAITLALGAWGILALATHFNRTSLVALIPSLVLVAWWAPASIYTCLRALGLYLSPTPMATSPLLVVLALIPPVLLVACVAVATANLRTSGGR